MTERDEDALWRSIVENYGERVILDLPDESPGAPAPLLDLPSGPEIVEDRRHPRRRREDHPRDRLEPRPRREDHAPRPADRPKPADPDAASTYDASTYDGPTYDGPILEPPPGSDADHRDLLDAFEDPEDHFVPPDPPRVPTPEPRRLLAWAGVLGVPVVVLILVVFHVTLPPWGSLWCLAWFVGGFGYLVATMRREPGPEDDWDDGARI